MQIEARVERGPFIYEGRSRSEESTVIVSQEVYRQFGPRGTAQLAFIRFREDRPTSDEDTIVASRSARKLAHENGVSLSEIVGTGKDGSIRVDDVRAFLKNRE